VEGLGGGWGLAPSGDWRQCWFLEKWPWAALRRNDHGKQRYSDDDEVNNLTNPNDDLSIPPDNDGDFISDLADPDDDNDGFSDEDEMNAGTDPFDENDFPEVEEEEGEASESEWEEEVESEGEIVDIDPPSVDVALSDPDLVVNVGESVEITVTANDQGSGINRIEITVEIQDKGDPPEELSVTDNENGTWSAQYTPAEVGSYDLMATAYDNADNSNFAILTFEAIDAGEEESEGEIEAEFEGQEEGDEVDELEAEIEGQEEGEGEDEIKAEFGDEEEGEGEGEERTPTDTTGPDIDVDIDPELVDVGGIVTIEVFALDRDSGIDHVEATVEGEPLTLMHEDGDTWIGQYTPACAGVFNVEALAFDNAGNSSDARGSFTALGEQCDGEGEAEGGGEEEGEDEIEFEGEIEGEGEGEGEIQMPYGPQAAIASTTGSLAGIREIRDSWLVSRPAVDNLMGLYYSHETERTVRTTLASNIKTDLTSKAIYKPAAFLLSMGLLHPRMSIGRVGL